MEFYGKLGIAGRTGYEVISAYRRPWMNDMSEEVERSCGTEIQLNLIIEWRDGQSVLGSGHRVTGTFSRYL